MRDNVPLAERRLRLAQFKSDVVLSKVDAINRRRNRKIDPLLPLSFTTFVEYEDVTEKALQSQLNVQRKRAEKAVADAREYRRNHGNPAPGAGAAAAGVGGVVVGGAAAGAGAAPAPGGAVAAGGPAAKLRRIQKDGNLQKAGSGRCYLINSGGSTHYCLPVDCWPDLRLFELLFMEEHRENGRKARTGFLRRGARGSMGTVVIKGWVDLRTVFSLFVGLANAVRHKGSSSAFSAFFRSTESRWIMVRFMAIPAHATLHANPFSS